MCPPNSPGTCLPLHRFRAIIVPNHVYTPAGPGSCLARFLLLPCGVRPVQGEEKDRKGRKGRKDRKGSAGGMIPPAPPRFALRLRRAADAVRTWKAVLREDRVKAKSRKGRKFRRALSGLQTQCRRARLRPPAVADRCPRFRGHIGVDGRISRCLREGWGRARGNFAGSTGLLSTPGQTAAAETTRATTAPTSFLARTGRRLQGASSPSSGGPGQHQQPGRRRKLPEFTPALSAAAVQAEGLYRRLELTGRRDAPGRLGQKSLRRSVFFHDRRARFFHA